MVAYNLDNCKIKHAVKDAIASNRNPFISLMLAAMKDSGCEVNLETHIVVEDCKMNVWGGLDPSNNQIVLCKNQFETISNEAQRVAKVEQILTHELIHAYDHCRAGLDLYGNPKHVMCTEIRAATLSGECMFTENRLPALLSGIKAHHKTCVKNSALRSFSSLFPHFSKAKRDKIFDEVFVSCYSDTDPFHAIPFNVNSARLSFRSYINRHRYNI
ncbi:mitochondrial inner membrane protease ATP23 homolog [Ciona intestinalis]